MSSKTVQPIRRREQGETKSRRSARQKREKRESAQSSAPTTYFDYNLMLVIIFLTCFGLIMLYSASAYSAQADFQDDMSYFIKQAMISAGSFGVMLVVSRIDYHVYGAFSFEIYVFAMIMMALVQTPLGTTINGARRWIQLPGNMTKEDFNVRIDEDNNLVISMEKKTENKEEKKEGRYLRREFSYSKFQQTMILPDNVDKEKISAAVENGVLSVQLPKISEEEVKKAEKQIEVK